MQNPMARVDVLSGLVFMLLGAASLIVSRDYPLGTSADMAAGYLPRLLSWFLVGFGALILLSGLARGSARLAPVDLRALGVVLVSICVFAVLIEWAGLAAASFASVVVATWAGERVGWSQTLMLAAALAAAAVLIFVAGLGIPVKVHPF